MQPFHFILGPLLIMLSIDLPGGLLPDLDPHCKYLTTSPAPILPLEDGGEPYFDKDIPRFIHQIWYGDPTKLERSKTAVWEDYTSTFAYGYKLWTEKDDPALQQIMKPENFHLMLLLRGMRNYWAASDIARLEILKHHGGIYVDCDFHPPLFHETYVDLKNLVSMKGLTLMTHNHAREVESSAIFVINGFLMSSKNHPIIVHAVDTVYANAVNWYSKTGNYDASYVTGPVLLNRSLSGCFNVVPCTYLKQYGMYTDW